MNVACFVNPDYGSGIARHTKEMVLRLAHHPDVRVEILASRRSLARNRDLTATLQHLPIRSLPFSNITIERLWKAIKWPRIDGYVSPSCDIVYAPAQTRLPTTRLPTLMTIHDIQAFEPDLPWSRSRAHRTFHRKWRSWLPKAVREATRIVTVSEFSKCRITELLEVDPSKIGVVGNGVSEVFFRARQPSTTPRKPSVVVVGGLRTKKGAADTLAVARILQHRWPEIYLDVVGENEADWSDAGRSVGNIRLHGKLPDDALAAMLACSTALLFLSPYEGFGIPAVEAMATGTPAVVAGAAALPEIVGEAGIVVTPGDHEGIAAVLRRLYEDVAWRDALGHRGVEHAAEYTWDSCVNRLVQELCCARTGGIDGR